MKNELKPYIIYFEFFGKKMKKAIIAESREHAERQIQQCIIFHKIEPLPDGDAKDFADKALKELKYFFGL
jgi:hypothetical protein